MEGFECIDIHKAKELIDKGNVFLLDVRDPMAYEEAHINQAVLLTDQTIESFIQSADKNKPVLCYCYHGNSSQMAALFFLENGFKQAYSVDGGFESWRQTYPFVTNS